MPLEILKDFDMDIKIRGDEIYNIRTKSQMDSNSSYFHRHEAFNINEPVYCTCSEKLEFNLESQRSENRYAICKCGKEYKVTPNLKMFYLFKE